jgi:26S proteasome regulatory subunit N5
MKIVIKRKDYIRLFVISKKINENNLNDDAIADLKVSYYAYLAIYYNHFNKHYDASQCYKTIWETLSTTKQNIPEVLDFNFKAGKINSLANYVAFLVLHPHS